MDLIADNAMSTQFAQNLEARLPDNPNVSLLLMKMSQGWTYAWIIHMAPSLSKRLCSRRCQDVVHRMKSVICVVSKYVSI